MKKNVFVFVFVFVAFLAGFLLWDDSAKCYGHKNCNACKSCNYCKHCAKDGGTCGVCKK